MQNKKEVHDNKTITGSRIVVPLRIRLTISTAASLGKSDPFPGDLSPHAIHVSFDPVDGFS